MASCGCHALFGQALLTNHKIIIIFHFHSHFQSVNLCIVSHNCVVTKKGNLLFCIRLHHFNWIKVANTTSSLQSQEMEYNAQEHVDLIIIFSYTQDFHRFKSANTPKKREEFTIFKGDWRKCPYHHLVHDDTPNECAGVILVPLAMPHVLGLGAILLGESGTCHHHHPKNALFKRMLSYSIIRFLDYHT